MSTPEVTPLIPTYTPPELTLADKQERTAREIDMQLRQLLGSLKGGILSLRAAAAENRYGLTATEVYAAVGEAKAAVLLGLDDQLTALLNSPAVAPGSVPPRPELPTPTPTPED